MKITDEAKKMLEEIMSSNSGDCLKATVQKSCCGSSFMLNVANLSDKDTPVFINSIPVLIDDNVKKASESVTIAVKMEN